MELKTIDNTLPLQQARLENSLKISSPAADKGSVAVKKAAREFESLFVEMMLKSMRDTVGKDTLTGGGRGEETFRSMLDEEYAKAASQAGNFGLATAIERELTRRGSAKGVNGAD